MAKLVIYHGDALDREIDLGETTARIGRGEENDIVLSDDTKGVSRFHAELRFEHGKYLVVDASSRNGVWASGARVSQAMLEPGVPVLLGPYKLVLKDERRPAPKVVPMPKGGDQTIVLKSPAIAEAAAASSKPEVAPAPVPAPAVVVKPTVVLPRPEAASPAPAAAATPGAAPPVASPEAAKPAPVASRPAAAPEPRPEPVPPPKPAPRPPVAEAPKAAEPAVAAKPPAARKPAAGRPTWVWIGGGVAAVALLGAIVLLTPLRSIFGKRTDTATVDAFLVAPVPAAPPVVAPVPPPAPPPPVVDAPVASAPQATPPPRPSPAPPPAPRPAAPPVSRPVPVAADPPVRQPAPVRPPAPPPARPPARPVNTADAFEQARLAIIRGDYLTAIDLLESVLKADPNYPRADNLLGVARSGAKNGAQLAIDNGNKAELSGDFPTALKQYEMALKLDPQSTSAPEAVRRLRARMLTEGEDEIKKAGQYFANDRDADAIAHYERALTLLPPDHKDVKTAKDRLAILSRAR